MFVFNFTILCILLLIGFCLSYSLSKLIIILLSKYLVAFALYILTIYHKAATNQCTIAHGTESETSTTPRIDTQSAFFCRWRHPGAHFW